MLDAITWSLFGIARKRDDSLINNQSNTAVVALVFEYENNYYRVQRSKKKEKTTTLDFQILRDRKPEDRAGGEHWTSMIDASPGAWKPLSGRTLRETESVIRDTLRLDYETFVNASFFLQGKADQFTQQRPGDRKLILGNILGLDIWEEYRQRASEKRRSVEAEIATIDGRLNEIIAELDQEEARRIHLKEIEAELNRLTLEREIQESTLDNLRQFFATLAEQKKMVATLAGQLETSTKRLDEYRSRLTLRTAEKEELSVVISHSADIEASYKELQTEQGTLQEWEVIAGKFREQEKERNEPLAEIQAAKARLNQERKSLLSQQEGMQALQYEVEGIQPQIEGTKTALMIAEAKLERKERLTSDLQDARVLGSDAKKENNLLYKQMTQLKERINNLENTKEAICPTCGRMLNTIERLGLIDQLTIEGTELGDRFRENKASTEETEQKIKDIEEQLTEISTAERDVRAQEKKLTQLTSRLEIIQGQLRAWESEGAPRLENVSSKLFSEDFSHAARKQLEAINAELKAIGYDAAEHDKTREKVSRLKIFDEEMVKLEKARSALAPLDREISDLKTQINILETQIDAQRNDYIAAADSLASAQEGIPDIDEAENNLMRTKENENRLRLEVGAAQQKVLVLDDLKTRRKNLDADREGFANQVRQYRTLERAFGKDGVPALLIEQALPQIESKANQVLERLSDGKMNVQFITQALYKDKKREDLRETLEIQIRDSAGERGYEMYSGGEAFRINFAIRLALSEVLAQRAGARLQMLVIDEGFGSQDALGRQRLIEAINLVKSDFEKILVITHIEELKDSFPTRIEVEKSELGSSVRII